MRVVCLALLHRFSDGWLVELPHLERVIHTARHDQRALQVKVLQTGIYVLAVVIGRAEYRA